MVKKLFKYEFIYYLRIFGLFLPIILLCGIITKMFQLLQNENAITQIAFGSSVFMLIVSCFALLLAPFLVGIIRFYKNLYSSEGYLTFALPVANAQHILVKLLSAMACFFVCLLTVIIAAAFAIPGEDMREIIQGFGSLAEDFREYGVINSALYALELLVSAFFSVASNMLLYYTCITIGQTAKKNRILAAIGVYFAYYIVSQILSTIGVIALAIIGSSGVLEQISLWSDAHPAAFTHITFLLPLLFQAALTALYWFVTQTIMTKKLNLE